MGGGVEILSWMGLKGYNLVVSYYKILDLKIIIYIDIQGGHFRRATIVNS